jgi:hypothetical protein
MESLVELGTLSFTSVVPVTLSWLPRADQSVGYRRENFSPGSKYFFVFSVFASAEYRLLNIQDEKIINAIDKTQKFFPYDSHVNSKTLLFNNSYE